MDGLKPVPKQRRSTAVQLAQRNVGIQPFQRPGHKAKKMVMTIPAARIKNCGLRKARCVESNVWIFGPTANQKQSNAAPTIATKPTATSGVRRWVGTRLNSSQPRAAST